MSQGAALGQPILVCLLVPLIPEAPDSFQVASQLGHHIFSG